MIIGWRNVDTNTLENKLKNILLTLSHFALTFIKNFTNQKMYLEAAETPTQEAAKLETDAGAR